MFGRLDLGRMVTSFNGTRVGGGVGIGVFAGASPGTETEQAVMRAITKRSESVFQICFIVPASY